MFSLQKNIYLNPLSEETIMNIGEPIRKVIVPKRRRDLPTPFPTNPRVNPEPTRIPAPNWPVRKPAEIEKERESC